MGRLITLWVICGLISAGMLLNDSEMEDEPLGAIVVGILFGPIGLGGQLSDALRAE
jgi:hypothetical protein